MSRDKIDQRKNQEIIAGSVIKKLYGIFGDWGQIRILASDVLF
jgi:hypothetical protein